MRKLLLVVFVLSSLLALTACAKGANSAGGASKAVEDYLQALVSQDQARISSLSCKNWEANALLELDSFQGVTAKVESPACSETGKNGESTLVQCQGKIVATYNNENQELPLNARTYKVQQEGGDWRVCGYQ